MGLITKLKEAVKGHHEEEEHVVEGSRVEVETEVKKTEVKKMESSSNLSEEELRVAQEVTAKADAAAAAHVTVVNETDAEVKVIDKGVENVEIKENAAIVQEKENVHERVEVQPVIEKVVDETEIQQVVQPIYDNQKVVTEEEQVLEAKHRENVEQISASDKARYESQSSQFADSSAVGEVSGETIVLAPKIQEVHKKKIVQEIQPVIQREIEHVHVVRSTQPITEHVVAGAKINELKVNAPVSIEEYKAKAAAATTTSASATTTASATTESAVSTSTVASSEQVQPIATEVEAIAIRED